MYIESSLMAVFGEFIQGYISIRGRGSTVAIYLIDNIIASYRTPLPSSQPLVLSLLLGVSHKHSSSCLTQNEALVYLLRYIRLLDHAGGWWTEREE